MTDATAARRWHRGVDRETIVDAAMRILDEDGLDALTMRRLASDLDVQAPSLYAHVHGKDDVLDLVVDRVLGTVAVPPPGGDPRTVLEAGFTAYRTALVGHPAVVGLVIARPRLGRAQAGLIERALDALTAAGLSIRDAVDAQVTLAAYVLGFVAQETARRSAPVPAFEPGPRLAAALLALAARPGDERFAIGLGRVLDGVGVVRRR